MMSYLKSQQYLKKRTEAFSSVVLNYKSVKTILKKREVIFRIILIKILLGLVKLLTGKSKDLQQN